MPPVYMPASMVKDAAEMGAIIDVEYYDLCPEYFETRKSLTPVTDKRYLS